MSNPQFKRVLVTGGAGFIGSHVAERLIARGSEVIVLDNLSTGRMENIPAGAHFVKGDVLDPDILRQSSSEVDAVIHLAAHVSIRASTTQYYDDAQTNVMGTLSVLRALTGSDVRKLVYASSMAVYGEAKRLPVPESHRLRPASPYGIGKLASEMYCQQLGRLQGFDVALMRYFNTYGPRQGFTPYVGVITIFIRHLLAGRPPVIFGTGEQIRDFVFVEDVAEATCLALEKGSGAINVGSGTGTSVNQLAHMLISLTGSRVKAEHAAPQPGEPSNSVANVRRASRLLGFTPQALLEEKLPSVIAWLRDHP